MILDITILEYERLREVLHRDYVTHAKRAGQQGRRNVLIAKCTAQYGQESLALEKKIRKQWRKQLRILKKNGTIVAEQME